MISRNFNQRITQGKKNLWRSSSLWGNKKQKGTTQIIASPLKSTVVNNEIKLERIEIWFRKWCDSTKWKEGTTLIYPSWNNPLKYCHTYKWILLIRIMN